VATASLHSFMYFGNKTWIEHIVAHLIAIIIIIMTVCTVSMAPLWDFVWFISWIRTTQSGHLTSDQVKSIYYNNNYECTTDQELELARCFVFTHQVAAVFCMKWRHGRHLETVMSNRTPHSVNRCIFTLRTVLPNFIPVRPEMTEP